MPRLARFTCDDSFYHVMTRGNNKQNVFLDDEDFLKYLELLSKYKDKYNVKVIHYVLMNNHVHLLLFVQNGNELSDMMKCLNLTYAQYFRQKYGGIGHLWQDRFKSFIIENGRYLLECGRYIELNPVVAGLVEKPEDYTWSSCKNYILDQSNEIIDYNPEFLGLSKDIQECKSIYKYFLYDGIENQDRRSENRFFRAGAYGSKQFIDNLIEKEGMDSKWSHPGKPKKNSK